MGKYRKISSISCLVLLIFFLMPLIACGSTINTAIDTNKDVTLTIQYRDKNQPLTDAVFQIYQIASLDEQGKRMVTDAFQDYPVNIESNDPKVWKSLADTLEGLIAIDNKQIPMASGKTDQNGNLVFGADKKLKPGLYLVTGKRHVQGERIYYAKPFLVQLPMQDTVSGWIYEITANSKMESYSTPGGGCDGEEPVQVSRKALKVWDDNGQEAIRPQSITVQLLRDGTVYDTVILTEDNNWRYEWPRLSSGYRWTVAEKNSGDYDVRVSQEGITFVITNTLQEKHPDEETPDGENPSTDEFPENPTSTGSGEPQEEETIVPGIPVEEKLPQTGQLWWPVAVLIASGMFFMVVGLFLRRGEYYGAE